MRRLMMVSSLEKGTPVVARTRGHRWRLGARRGPVNHGGYDRTTLDMRGLSPKIIS
jgi:hypothetical protein